MLIIKNALLIFSFFPLILNANSGREIMKKVLLKSRAHKTQGSDVLMIIKNSKNETRQRHFSLLKKMNNKQSKVLIKFYKPANVKGVGVLSHSNDSSNETLQWTYFPALKGSAKRLIGSERNKSFIGSDFTYRDIAGRTLDEDTHQLISSDKISWTIKSTPKKQEKNGYQKYITRIYKKNLIPISIIFYNQEGEKLKTLTNKKIFKKDSYYIIQYSEMVNHKTKGETSLNQSNIEIKISIKDNDVGIRGLTY